MEVSHFEVLWETASHGALQGSARRATEHMKQLL